MRSHSATAAILLGLLASACDDLEGFSTGPGEAYCGAVTLGADFRTGLSPRVQMRLRIDDATALDGAEPPGTIWTYEAADGSEPEQRMIDGAPLSPIRSLAHDPLSQLEFGEGRERNAIFGVKPVDPDAGSILAILSLRSDDAVEVRLLRAGPETTGSEPTPPTRHPIFGLFTLTKRQDQCGF